MIDKLKSVLARDDELEELMNQPDAMRDMKAFTKMAREHSGLTKLVEEAKNYIVIYDRLQEDEKILNEDDPELKELVKDADSVTFCLSKGLAAPIGSVVCGNEKFIYRARRNGRLRPPTASHHQNHA